jgi:hypothetical protein
MKGASVSKQLREVFKDINAGDQQIGALEAVREGIQAIAPGLSLSKIFSDIGQELKEQAKHGAHELATALLRGTDGYVMYQRSSEGRKNEGQQLPEQQQEQSRGGREL